MVLTPDGAIELSIPRDRHGRFDPALIAKYRRRFTHRCHILETGNDSYRFRNHATDIKKEHRNPTSNLI